MKTCIVFVFFPHFKWTRSFSELLKCDSEYLYDVLMPSQARTDMEQQTIEGASTSDAVGFITVVQSLKRKIKNWEKSVEVCNITYIIWLNLRADKTMQTCVLIGYLSRPTLPSRISHIGSARKNKFCIDQVLFRSR